MIKCHFDRLSFFCANFTQVFIIQDYVVRKKIEIIFITRFVNFGFTNDFFRSKSGLVVSRIRRKR